MVAGVKPQDTTGAPRTPDQPVPKVVTELEPRRDFPFAPPAVVLRWPPSFQAAATSGQLAALQARTIVQMLGGSRPGWVVAGVRPQVTPLALRWDLGGRSRHQPKPILPSGKRQRRRYSSAPNSGTEFMAKDPEPVVIICCACGARYMTQANWLESAAEFHCSCGARLKADTGALFQIRSDAMELPEITLHSLHE